MTAPISVKDQLGGLDDHLKAYNDFTQLQKYVYGMQVPNIQLYNNDNRKILAQFQSIIENRKKYQLEIERMERAIVENTKQIELLSNNIKVDPYTAFLNEQLHYVDVSVHELNAQFVEFIHAKFQETQDQDHLKNYVISAIINAYRVIFSEEFTGKLEVPHYTASLVEADRKEPSRDYRVHVASELSQMSCGGSTIDDDQQNYLVSQFGDQLSAYIRCEQAFPVDLDTIQDAVSTDDFDINSINLDQELTKLHLVIFRVILDLFAGMAEYDMGNAGEESANDGTIVIGEFIADIANAERKGDVSFGWYF